MVHRLLLRLESAQLAERIDFTFTDGVPGQSREEMLLHVTIHGASHRGQVGWIMIENSITPPADDRLTSYLHKAEAAAQADASSRKTDTLGFALLATIILVMTAWIGGLVWAAMAFLNWLVA